MRKLGRFSIVSGTFVYWNVRENRPLCLQVDSNYYFGEIDDNPIIVTDSKLLDEVIEGNFDD